MIAMLSFNFIKDYHVIYQYALSRSKLPASTTEFSGRSEKNKMTALVSDWLIHFRLLLWNHRTEFNETWQEASSQRHIPSLWGFFLTDQKNKIEALAFNWRRHFQLLLWNCWTEFIETLQDARSQRPLWSLCFSGRIGKTRWPPWHLIGWDIYDFSETAEWNLTKLDRKQLLNVRLLSLCLRVDRKNKMAALVSNWLRNFPLLLWNRWTEFNETWQEGRS